MKAVIHQNLNLSLLLYQRIEELLPDNFEMLRITDDKTAFSVYHAHKLYMSGEIEKILLPSDRTRTGILGEIEYLVDLGWKKEDILIASIDLMRGKKNIQFATAFMSADEFCYMTTLLVPVTEHCNLNCKGCSHFSPLLNEKKFLDFGRWSKDLQRLKELVPHIQNMNFLGGEPLLHEHLDEFITFARSIYPYTHFQIVTNGILLPLVPSKLLDAIKKTSTSIYLSVYPDMVPKITEWIEFLQSEEISYTLVNAAHFTPMLLDSREEFPLDTTEFICSNCPMMMDGILARCPMCLTVHYFNEAFDKNYPYKDSLIDIYDKKLTSKKLFQKLNEVHELCCYCSRYKMTRVKTNKWENYRSGEERKEKDWIL
ncbi:MAG: radical SAM protein [Lachnospiraceae bacterium]|nr:radical SAM protein [Lachnospiraceae bacterium]